MGSNREKHWSPSSCAKNTSQVYTPSAKVVRGKERHILGMIAILLTHVLQTPKGVNKVLKVPRASK